MDCLEAKLTSVSKFSLLLVVTAGDLQSIDATRAALSMAATQQYYVTQQVTTLSDFKPPSSCGGSSLTTPVQLSCQCHHYTEEVCLQHGQLLPHPCSDLTFCVCRKTVHIHERLADLLYAARR